MAVSSMTGFARIEGSGEAASWFWELRSVNGKGFDLRLRLPPGLEGLEAKLRALAVKRFTRGTVHASLTMTRKQGALEVRLNEAVLQQVVTAAKRAAELTGGSMPDTATLLSLRGVLEIADQDAGSALAEEDGGVLLADFKRALGELEEARMSEGDRLKDIVGEQIDEVERLTGLVEASPARGTEAIRARISDQVARLVGTDQKFDADRLHQEAVMIATRADVEEELKRLKAHVSAGRELLAAGGAMGRKLDFLAQEFQREANTLCSKSNATEITEAGLAMKVKIDQLREQVQNLE